MKYSGGLGNGPYWTCTFFLLLIFLPKQYTRTIAYIAFILYITNRPAVIERIDDVNTSLCVLLLSSLWSAWHKLESSRKRKPQWRKFPLQFGLCESLFWLEYKISPMFSSLLDQLGDWEGKVKQTQSSFT